MMIRTQHKEDGPSLNHNEALPAPRSDGELTDDDLEQVAGGTTPMPTIQGGKGNDDLNFYQKSVFLR